MVELTRRPFLAAILICLTGAACGSGRSSSPQLTPAAPEPTAAQATLPPPDPIEQLIELSQGHFEAGEYELGQGHLERAREEFDRALEVLIESPYGARTNARLREHFDRLVDRISTHEISALAAGDGFAEKRYEPASIDELLSEAMFPPDATADVRDAIRSDFTAHDVPIPLNNRVAAYVQLFQGRLRDWVTEGLARGSQYIPMIQSVLRAEGLPLDLAYIPLIESAFKPNALSRAKAKGVWQFMRATANENGLKQDWYVDERSDPEKATAAAAKYLRTLYTAFDGDWHLALASYNGGPGRVQRAMKRSGLRDFWSISARGPRYLPRETREYVPMILAAMIIAKNPTQYGFELSAVEPVAYEKVVLPGAVDLRRVAEWTGTTIDQIQALNPELRRWTTPVRDSAYELKVPAGTAEPLRTRLAEIGIGELASLNWYTVRRGETLLSIARKLRVNRADLAEANYLSIRSRLQIGQELIIPRDPTLMLAARSERPVPAADVVAVSASEAGRSDLTKYVYRVRRGDTLSSIARRFSTTVSALRTWNGIHGSRIYVGDRLTIFASRMD